MTLAHDRRGAGEPLVLIHGMSTERHVWDLVLPLLEGEREVIAVDLPGFGDSPPDLDHPTPPRMARAVAALLDELGIERAHVAGFSMGGWTTLELNKLGRTLSACAICPAGFWNRWEREWCKAGVRNAHLTLNLLGERRVEKLMQAPPARRLLNLQYMQRGDRMTPEQALATTRAAASSPGYAATFAALHEGHFTGGADVTPPVTVAWGDKDKLLLPRQAERARKAIPQARHLWLPGCGHFPMVDDPETTARAILTSA